VAAIHFQPLAVVRRAPHPLVQTEGFEVGAQEFDPVSPMLWGRQNSHELHQIGKQTAIAMKMLEAKAQ
jgi:hypothetical protein